MPSRSHSSSRTAARSLRVAVTGPAVLLLALAGGIAGTWPAGAPAPAASVSSPAAATVELDALAAAAAPAAQPGPRQIAKAMLPRFHWSAARQFPYLDKLWNRESGWRVHAYNRYSGAAGIPQADPGWKMASAGPNWSSNATTQIRWGLRYIQSRYGSPRGAWEHEISAGWY
jgi:hypothetical protein